MMCFKHLVPYALLLPMSSASPMFIFLFALLLFYTVRPCGYCLVLISVLFLSTSSSSPFISIPSHPTPSIVDPTLLMYPMRKTWLDLNNGYLFDPFIRAFSSNATSYPERYIPSPSSKAEARKEELPDGYIDLRYRGLGFIWDFGWRRTEEGMEWEMGDWIDVKRKSGMLEEKEIEEMPLRSSEGHELEDQVMNEEGERKWQWVSQLLGKVWRTGDSIAGDW